MVQPLNPCLAPLKCQERGWSSFCPSGGHHLEPRPVCDCLRHVCNQTRPRSFHAHMILTTFTCVRTGTYACDVGVKWVISCQIKSMGYFPGMFHYFPNAATTRKQAMLRTIWHKVPHFVPRVFAERSCSTLKFKISDKEECKKLAMLAWSKWKCLPAVLAKCLHDTPGPRRFAPALPKPNQ